MDIRCIILAAFAFFVSACGIRGGTEPDEPLWGTAKQDYQLYLQQQEQAP